MAEYLGLEKIAKIKDWEQAAIDFFHTLEDGLQTLNIAPQTDEERYAVFEVKRDIVKLMVEQVTITRDRQLRIIYKVNILKLLGLEISEVQQVGTYSRK